MRSLGVTVSGKPPSRPQGGDDAAISSWRPRLARRDIVLLPLIALVTIVIMGVGAEAIARWVFPEDQRDACQVSSKDGGEFKPDCTSRVKLAEGPWVENSYNECGYRSASPCGAQPAGTMRVGVLGTSIARGEWVPYPQTFAGRVEHDLSALCGRPVDLQNVSIAVSQSAEGYLWHLNARKAAEALKLKPLALVLVTSPFDLGEYQKIPPGLEGGTAAPAPAAGAGGGGGGGEAGGLMGRLRTLFKTYVSGSSRMVLAAQHVFYEEPHRYVPMFLKHGDNIDYLRPPFTPAWRMRVRIADIVIRQVADEAKAAGVPLIVVYVPQRAQALLTAMPELGQGTDPFALGQALRRITTEAGASFVDLTDQTRAIHDQSDLYYPVDSHPTSEGHALIASGLEQAMLKDVPAFAACHAAAPNS